jgi:hypothetical protein
VLLLGFHTGDTTTLKTNGYGGHSMKVHIHRRPIERIADWLDDAGLLIEVRLLHCLDDTAARAMLIVRPRAATDKTQQHDVARSRSRSERQEAPTSQHGRAYSTQHSARRQRQMS